MFVITFYVQTLLNFDSKYDSKLLSFCEYCGQKIKEWRLLQSRLLVILWAMSRCNLIWFDITRSKPESDRSNRKRVALILFSLSLSIVSLHTWLAFTRLTRALKGRVIVSWQSFNGKRISIWLFWSVQNGFPNVFAQDQLCWKVFTLLFVRFRKF